MAKKAVRRVVIRTLEDVRDWLSPQLMPGWHLHLHATFYDSATEGSRHVMSQYSLSIDCAAWEFDSGVKGGTAAELARNFQLQIQPKIDAAIRDRAVRASRPKIEDKRPRLTHTPAEKLVFTKRGNNHAD
jgi:hypothetical protein